MEDLKKVQEFFSKPLEEVTNDYSPLSYATLVAKGKMDIEDAMKETGFSYVLLKQLVDKVKGVAQDIREEQETGVGMVKKQLDALGVKYEMSKTDKVKPFKVIYKPINKSDKFYDEFEDIVDLFNLKGVVKSSMNEANGFKSGKEFINIKLQKYPKAVAKINQLISMVGESNFTMEMAEWLFNFFNNASFENPVNEAKEEDPTDIIAMDVPLFLRMLEYAREDAEQDIDLHKVTERAIEAVKLRGLLSMEDYQDIVGEPIDEMTGYSKYLSTPENPKGKTQGLTQDVMDKILLKIATMGDDDVEETTRLGEGVIYEELCPKGKAYIKKRQAAGEKSSAYLSGRAVKVCKGQMKG